MYKPRENATDYPPARVNEATIPLKQEIATATEELAALRQEISVLKTHRPDPPPGRQGGSETHQPGIAAANPPTIVGVATLSPAVTLPPLNKSLLFSNVTLHALQAVGIPVPSMETAPQFPPTRRRLEQRPEPPAREPSPDQSTLMVIYLLRIFWAGTPTRGGIQTMRRVDDEKSPSPVGRGGRLTVANDERTATRRKGTRARPRRPPPTRNPLRSQSHLRLQRRRSAPNRKSFLFGSRRTTGSEVYATTKHTASWTPIRPWTTSSTLPPVKGCNISSWLWESINSAGWIQSGSSVSWLGARKILTTPI